MGFPDSFSIEKDSFRLRMGKEEDIPHIFSATKVKGFNDGMQWDSPACEEDLLPSIQHIQKVWREGTAFGFTIADKEKDVLMGKISIRPTAEEAVWNIGFWTHPDHQGKGLMTKAVKAVLEFGFKDLGARKIEACYVSWNEASRRVLEKNGFRHEAHIEKGMQKNGEWFSEERMVVEEGDNFGARAQK